MEKSIFEFRVASDYIASRLGDTGRRTGAKGRAAGAIGCDSAYITKVIKKQSSLSLEQALRLNTFLHHSEQESEYFLLLVSWERAGTKELRQYFGHKIDASLRSREEIKVRVGHRDSLADETKAIYYSDWLYSAVHIALSATNLKDAPGIARFLGQEVERVTECLFFLEKHGLIERDERSWRNRVPLLHLPSDSPFLPTHHINWRLRAIDQIRRRKSSSLHYSVAFTTSAKRAAALKAAILEVIEDHAKKNVTEPDEEVWCWNVDLFDLKGSSST